MSGFFNSRKKQAGNSEDSGAGLRPEDIAAPDFNESTPDLNASAARFLDETYHLTDQPIADSPPDVRPESLIPMVMVLRPPAPVRRWNLKTLILC